VTGLGSAFIKGGWLSGVVRGLYRLALARSQVVFFQNLDDQRFFISNGLVPKAIADCLPGSGVDLQKFAPRPLSHSSRFRFLLIARMLWDKGVGEYVEAARLLRKQGLNVEFCLLGFLDVKNPSAISCAQMDAWVTEGVVRYLGVSDHVGDEIARADCVVLPSYREGIPRSLLEAAAIARPVITTDVVGCREVVEDGVTGLLCQPRDAVDLADKMGQMVSASRKERETMGRLGRRKMELEFDEKLVIDKYLDAIAAVLARRIS
jgi:glycosyltransferase involved in cell wall biosynthesis